MNKKIKIKKKQQSSNGTKMNWPSKELNPTSWLKGPMASTNQNWVMPNPDIWCYVYGKSPPSFFILPLLHYANCLKYSNQRKIKSWGSSTPSLVERRLHLLCINLSCFIICQSVSTNEKSVAPKIFDVEPSNKQGLLPDIHPVFTFTLLEIEV